MNNEKGLTLIELMISMTILLIIVISSFQFFESYSYQSSEFGEYLTAKHLAVGALEEERKRFLEDYSVEEGRVYDDMIRANKTSFKVEVNIENLTDEIAILTDDTKMIKITAKTHWKLRKVEVSAYVSAR